jgi:P-loop containing dynein motor region D4
VGVSGSGRRSSVMYVAHLLGMQFETFYTGRNYGAREFKKDIRRVMELAGA